MAILVKCEITTQYELDQRKAREMYELRLIYGHLAGQNNSSWTFLAFPSIRVLHFLSIPLVHFNPPSNIQDQIHQPSI